MPNPLINICSLDKKTMLKQFPNDDNTIHPDSESEQYPLDLLAWVADQELAAWHLNKQIADGEY